MSSRLTRIANQAIMKAALGLTQGRHYRALMRAAKNPRDAQSQLLQKILTANQDADFGKRCGFAALADVEDYRRAVPPQSYEQLREDIERQELTGHPCLTAERPIYYHRTSGTMGSPKNIPVTATGLSCIKRHQRISAYCQVRGSAMYEGKIFSIGGQAVEGKMPGGTPFGSASGLIYDIQPAFVRKQYVLPPEVADISDYESRYLAMAIYGLAEKFVSCISTANPSTFLRLLTTVDQHTEKILKAVHDGRMPDELAPFRIKPRPRRATEVARLIDRHGRISFAEIWPELRAVLCWTGGSCAAHLATLSSVLPDSIQIVELGYLASEVRGTINIDATQNTCLPSMLDTFFEFADRRDWEAGHVNMRGLHEIEQNREYYVFVTTMDGLFRYDMNDIVYVCGMTHATPTLTFVQKGQGTTNITGEKLCEAQVLAAVGEALKERALLARFFIALANRHSGNYTLFIESDSAGTREHFDREIDRRLRALNIEYDSKRQSGRLGPLEVRWLQSGAGDRYRMERVAAGQRDAQFKYLHLQNAHECTFDFNRLTETT